MLAVVSKGYLQNFDIPRAGLHFNFGAATTNFSAHFFSADGALHRDRAIQGNRAGTGVSVEVKGGVQGKAEAHGTGTRVHDPTAARIAFGGDFAASGPGFERAAHPAQLDSA